MRLCSLGWACSVVYNDSRHNLVGLIVSIALSALCLAKGIWNLEKDSLRTFFVVLIWLKAFYIFGLGLMA